MNKKNKGHVKDNQRKISLIAFFIILISGLTIAITVTTIISNKDHSISSSIPYNGSLCSSTSYSYENNSFKTGVRLSLIDKTTGKIINGSGNLETRYGGGGIGTDSFSCSEGISDSGAIITAYAKGYSPKVIRFGYEKDRLSTIEIPMTRSCSGAPGYFENLRMLGKYSDKNREGVYEMLDMTGINSSDMEFDCIEANMGRGGYIKAAGKYNDGMRSEIFYRWGWCSSGGSGCGWSICVKTDDAAQMDLVREKLCQKIISRISHDDTICLGEERDNTGSIRERCLAGEFERGNTISIVQESNRCISTAVSGDFDCINS